MKDEYRALFGEIQGIALAQWVRCKRENPAPKEISDETMDFAKNSFVAGFIACLRWIQDQGDK